MGLPSFQVVDIAGEGLFEAGERQGVAGSGCRTTVFVATGVLNRAALFALSPFRQSPSQTPCTTRKRAKLS